MTQMEQQTELVLTGPATPFVATRRTEQVLLDLINQSRKTLFMVSFVSYQWKPITDALQAALARGVVVRVLLEASKKNGGTLDSDLSKGLQRAIPGAIFYHWTEKTTEFKDGKVHAKIAVADDEVAFLTSANLTGHAMEKNLEAGVLFRGGEIPGDISKHLQGLIDIEIITKTLTA